MHQNLKIILWSILAVTILAITLHDIILAACTTEPTYTMDVRRISSKWPIVAAAVGLFFGFLLCHFFWWD